MAEPTAPTSDSTEPDAAAVTTAAPTPPTDEAAAASGEKSPGSFNELMFDKPLGIRDLLEAGCHFGHQTQRWNPRMKPYLFGERNGVHIVDLDQTLPRFQEALEFIRDTVAAGGKVLFVSTKRQAQEPVRLAAERAEQFYVNRRWLGGMLTNFKTVRKSIERFKELLELVGDEEKVAELSKKELSRVNRSIEKYKKSLDGIKEMVKLPDVIFVIDVNREAIAVSEGDRLGIPIVAVVDSNCDPLSIDFTVPGNDDSTRAIELYLGRVADACIEGAMAYNERVQSETSAQAEAQADSDKAATGRVVVEIKQQPRRGRGAHSAGPDERGPGGPGGPGGGGGGAPAADKPASTE
jgi:small subunit ribosomal protein S2